MTTTRDRPGGLFQTLLDDIGRCKTHKTCPSLQWRCYYFEPNPVTAPQWRARGFFTEPIDRRAMFVCESPGPGSEGSEVVSVGRCWNERRPGKRNERFHRVRKKYGFENCYITNSVKCGVRSGSRHTDAEVAACSPFLMREIQLVRPMVAVGVGKNAMRVLKQIVEEMRFPPRLFQITHYSVPFNPAERWDQEFPSLLQLVSEASS